MMNISLRAGIECCLWGRPALAPALTVHHPWKLSIFTRVTEVETRACPLSVTFRWEGQIASTVYIYDASASAITPTQTF